VGKLSEIWTAVLAVVGVTAALVGVLSQVVLPALRRRRENRGRERPFATIYCRWSDEEVRQFQKTNSALLDRSAPGPATQEATVPAPFESAATVAVKAAGQA
jgi:hypothetical protein